MKACVVEASEEVTNMACDELLRQVLKMNEIEPAVRPLYIQGGVTNHITQDNSVDISRRRCRNQWFFVCVKRNSRMRFVACMKGAPLLNSRSTYQEFGGYTRTVVVRSCVIWTIGCAKTQRGTRQQVDAFRKRWHGGGIRGHEDHCLSSKSLQSVGAAAIFLK